jgi:predicted transcriptional regulator
VSREAAERAESKSFLSRVFDGQAAPALVHLLAESRDRLSAKEIQELRDLLARKEKS